MADESKVPPSKAMERIRPLLLEVQVAAEEYGDVKSGRLSARIMGHEAKQEGAESVAHFRCANKRHALLTAIAAALDCEKCKSFDREWALMDASKAELHRLHREVTDLQSRDASPTYRELRAQLAAALDEGRKDREALGKFVLFAQYIATSYDHDEDAHSHGTACRVCDAQQVLKDAGREVRNG